MSFAKSLLASLLWTGILMMAPNTSFARAAGGGGGHFIDLAIDTYSPPANALVNIFDTKTKKLVDQPAYVVVDLPKLGSMGQFGTYMAKFIGRGG